MRFVKLVVEAGLFYCKTDTKLDVTMRLVGIGIKPHLRIFRLFGHLLWIYTELEQIDGKIVQGQIPLAVLSWSKDENAIVERDFFLSPRQSVHVEGTGDYRED
jgi:hypothetical protein